MIVDTGATVVIEGVNAYDSIFARVSTPNNSACTPDTTGEAIDNFQFRGIAEFDFKNKKVKKINCFISANWATKIQTKSILPA